MEDTPNPPLAEGNLAFVEQLYAQYLDDPATVDPAWHDYFRELSRADGDRHAARRAVDGPSFQPSSIFNPPSTAVASEIPEALLQPVADFDESDLPRLPANELNARMRLLARVQLFSDLPDEELALVARIARQELFADGAFLCREAEGGNSLFVLSEGHLLIERKGQLVATLNAGEVVGELAVLDSQPRSADVKAQGDATVLTLEGPVLLGLVLQRPRLGRGFLRRLAARLRERRSQQDKVNRLIHAYRVRGHLRANLDPLGRPRDTSSAAELELEHWGLEESDLDALFSSTTIAGTTTLTLRQIIKLLEATYCQSVGVQFMHIDDVHPKNWLINRLEDSEHHRHLSRDEQRRILTKLTDAEIFEQFIHKKFLGAKRFSLEGAETLIPLLDLALEEAGDQGVREVVFGMAHRGRLNVLVNILGKSPAEVFDEFEDARPEEQEGRGDVKYHLGFSSDHTTSRGDEIHLSMCFNPSHLEFVNPVALGRVRAKQDRAGDSEHRQCMAILIHGDAAFSGQGVSQEVFNMATLPGYRTGGALHIIVNNQIGFTTSPDKARSTVYATDVARMLHTPVFHVNGEDPEAVAHVVRTAMDYRHEFGTDIIIDMYCYRRYGHNEGDEPSYTQPLLYETIRKRKTVREGYLDHLLDLGGVGRDEADQIQTRRREDLEVDLGKARRGEVKRQGVATGQGLWRPYTGGLDHAVEPAETALSKERLAEVLQTISQMPGEFNLNRKLKRFFGKRLDMADGGALLDWGTAEALAFASLVAEGSPVRLSGQDCGRGTFSHRHAILYDSKTGAMHIPIDNLADDQARFQVWDSPLSEIGVLGFEYGYSLDTPDGLTLWEAQFGDFSNVAQVIIDQFISSSEDKWRRLSGLVMLLPHGFEGQGPEHSSARLERFLTLAAEDNLQVVNLTTPAQLFHCLRRQVVRPLRKPLVVMSPKSLLRLPAAVSPLDDLASGRFERVLLDPETDPKKVRRVLLTSGKVYYELVAEREEQQRDDVAIVRLEQYYPLDVETLGDALATQGKKFELVWVQEEPLNQGAWPFLKLHYVDTLAERFGAVECVSRPASASPATGSAAAHKKEQAKLLADALG